MYHVLDHVKNLLGKMLPHEVQYEFARHGLNRPLRYGAVVTAGTSAYEHWDHLKAIFSGEEMEPDVNLKDVLPDPLQDEIIFDLNSDIKPAAQTKGVSEVQNNRR